MHKMEESVSLHDLEKRIIYFYYLPKPDKQMKEGLHREQINNWTHNNISR